MVRENTKLKQSLDIISQQNFDFQKKEESYYEKIKVLEHECSQAKDEIKKLNGQVTSLKADLSQTAATVVEKEKVIKETEAKAAAVAKLEK